MRQWLTESILYTGLFKMIVRVLTTCHTQYTWDSMCICIFLFNRTTLTLQVFVTYLTGALYVHHLWFYKHQHDNRVRSACQRWWFQWWFWFVPSVQYTHAPCLLKLCIPPSNGIVRWCRFPNLVRNCCWTIIPWQSFWITLYLCYYCNKIGLCHMSSISINTVNILVTFLYHNRVRCSRASSQTVWMWYY